LAGPKNIGSKHQKYKKIDKKSKGVKFGDIINI